MSSVLLEKNVLEEHNEGAITMYTHLFRRLVTLGNRTCTHGLVSQARI